MKGPILTDQNKELVEPVLMCRSGEERCEHSLIHDFHYFYCSAQDAPNQHENKDGYYYPWRGAGKHLPRGPYPDAGCPYSKPCDSAVSEATNQIKENE